MANNTQIVFSFDTTGSMYPCLAEVRRRLAESVGRVLKEVPDVEIGIVAHGDACDGFTRGYRFLDFTNDVAVLQGFIKTVESTGGGDAPEWYEYVLLKVPNDFSWHSDSRKMLVMIGDAQPHPVGYRQGNYTCNTSWQEAAMDLADMGVAVHTVQCLGRTHDDRFWRPLAEKTNGYAVELAQFSNITELIVALGYRYDQTEEIYSKLRGYESELKAAGKLNRNVSAVIDTLLERKAKTFVESSSDADLSRKAVPPSRFQVFRLDHDARINDFVREMGLTFRVGRGFYQWSKPVMVQSYKEVVLRDKASGDMFSGDDARRLIGLPIATNYNLRNPINRAKYDIFIQSTSATRKLLAGTEFMYEAVTHG